MNDENDNNSTAYRTALEAIEKINAIGPIELAAHSVGHADFLAGCSSALSAYYYVGLDESASEEDRNKAAAAIAKTLSGIIVVGHLCASQTIREQNDSKRQATIAFASSALRNNNIH